MQTISLIHRRDIPSPFALKDCRCKTDSLFSSRTITISTFHIKSFCKIPRRDSSKGYRKQNTLSGVTKMKPSAMMKTPLLMLLLTGAITVTGCQQTAQVQGQQPVTNAPAIQNKQPVTNQPESATQTVTTGATGTATAAKPTTVTTAPAPVQQAPAASQPQTTLRLVPSAENQPQAAANVRFGKVTAARLASFTTGWLGGEGWIAKTTNAGQTWSVQKNVTGTVTQLFALNDQVAWATIQMAGKSTDFQLLHTTNGGKTWNVAGKVPQEGFLHFVSATEAFSGNWRTTDGGKTWSKLPLPPKTVGDAYFHDKANGWAVTYDNVNMQIQRTADGGKTWKAVMTKHTIALTNAIIRSAGSNNAWVECIGDSGMNQTSYSLFHTADGGKSWQTVIAKSSAGGGPAPGFPMEYTGGPTIGGSSPGALYVLNTKEAYIGAQCMACDKPNTIGWTTDGGKTVAAGTAAFEGFGEQLLAFADAKHGWWICTDQTAPSVMYTTADGGQHWKKAHVFAAPSQSK